MFTRQVTDIATHGSQYSLKLQTKRHIENWQFSG